jgi:hypothetical protein
VLATEDGDDAVTSSEVLEREWAAEFSESDAWWSGDNIDASGGDGETENAPEQLMSSAAIVDTKSLCAFV